MVRDREESPAKPKDGQPIYNICYVNGFQTQPHTDSQVRNELYKIYWNFQHAINLLTLCEKVWEANPDLILRDASGKPVIDPNWPDERILDITTPVKEYFFILLLSFTLFKMVIITYNPVTILIIAKKQ